MVRDCYVGYVPQVCMYVCMCVLIAELAVDVSLWEVGGSSLYRKLFGYPPCFDGGESFSMMVVVVAVGDVICLCL